MSLGNLELNAGSGGANLPTYDDGTRRWPVGLTAFVVSTGTPDVPAVVTPTTGLPVRLADASGYLATLPVSLASVPSHAVTNAGTFAVQATQSGAWAVDTELPAAAALSDAFANPTAPAVGAFVMGWNNTTWERVQSQSGQLAVNATIAGTPNVFVADNDGSITVDNDGTFAVQAEQSGAWNVGTVTTVTTVAAVTSISNALPAGTNLLGRVSASQETGTIYQGTTARTPAFAAIDAATSGDNTLVAAQGAGNKIRVTSLFLVAAGAVAARFESGAGGTALTGQMNLAANGGFVLPHNPNGWFETAANALLNLELSGAVSVDGSLSFIVVT
jgi:hypothetical protein